MSPGSPSMIRACARRLRLLSISAESSGSLRWEEKLQLLITFPMEWPITARLKDCHSTRARRAVMGHSIGNVMRSWSFSSHRKLPDDSALIDNKRKRLAHARIIEGLPGDIEAIKVSSKIGESVKIGAIRQHVEQFYWYELLVPNDV